MSTSLSNVKTPSMALLRTFFKPQPCGNCQIRTHTTNYMPRSKYAKITSLDKLHRKQKKELRQERLNSEIRAKKMQPPPSAYEPSINTVISSTVTDSSGPDSSIPKSPTTASTHITTPASPITQPSNLPYTITRTPSAQLPVYQKTKSGGTKHLTTLRKLSGNLKTLREHLRDALAVEQYFIDQQGRKKENVAINWRTRQINVRGWRAPEIKQWAQMVGF